MSCSTMGCKSTFGMPRQKFYAVLIKQQVLEWFLTMQGVFGKRYGRSRRRSEFRIDIVHLVCTKQRLTEKLQRMHTGRTYITKWVDKAPVKDINKRTFSVESVDGTEYKKRVTEDECPLEYFHATFLRRYLLLAETLNVWKQEVGLVQLCLYRKRFQKISSLSNNCLAVNTSSSYNKKCLPLTILAV